MSKQSEVITHVDQRLAPARRFIGLKEVKSRVNLGKTAIYARMKNNKFPKRCELGWLESDINAFMDAMIAEPSDDSESESDHE